MATFDRLYATFYQVYYCKYSSVLYHFREWWGWRISWPWNRSPCTICTSLKSFLPVTVGLWSVFIHFYTASLRKKAT